MNVLSVITGNNCHDSLDIFKVLNAGCVERVVYLDHFYFWDMAVGPDNMRRIQTVIAAQHVMSTCRATHNGSLVPTCGHS